MLLNVFGYTITIRKQRAIHPRDCQGYAKACRKAKETTTASLRQRYGRNVKTSVRA